MGKEGKGQRADVAHERISGRKETEGIRTLNTNMDVVLLSGLYFSSSIISLRERIEGLEILDVRGHEIDWGRSVGAKSSRAVVCGCGGKVERSRV